MIFFGIYVCLFCLVLFLSFMDKEKDKYVVGAYIAIAVVLVLIVGLRPIGLDKDSGEYATSWWNPLSTSSPTSPRNGWVVSAAC